MPADIQQDPARLVEILKLQKADLETRLAISKANLEVAGTTIRQLSRRCDGTAAILGDLNRDWWPWVSRRRIITELRRALS